MLKDQLSRRNLIKGASATTAAAALSPAITQARSHSSNSRSLARRQDNGTIVFWMFGGVPGEVDFRRAQIAQFEEETGYAVDLQERPWENQRQDILAALTGGEVPDLMNLHHKYVGEFGETGDLQALEEFPDYDEVAQRFVPAYLGALEQDGNHYGLPTAVFPFILAVNQPMLDAAGASTPTNWDEFQEVAQSLSNPDEDLYGYTIPGGVNLDSAYRWVPWLYKAGGRVLSEDWSEVTFNDEAGVAALEMLVELQEAGAIPPGNAAYAFQENADVWGAERAAMSTEGPWWPGVMRDQYNMDLSILSVAPVPAQAEPVGPHAPGTLVDVIMMSILSRGNNVEGAWELLKFMRTPESDIEFVNETGSALPTTAQPYDDEDSWTVTGRETYATESEAAITWPNHPQITEIQMAIAQGLNAAFTGTATPQEALDQAAEEATDILEG